MKARVPPAMASDMYDTVCAAWLKVGMDAWLLAAEASWVMGLRMVRLAGGGDALARETALMVIEKIGARLELRAGLIGRNLTPLSGAQTVLRHYRGNVVVNRRRLSR